MVTVSECVDPEVSASIGHRSFASVLDTPCPAHAPRGLPCWTTASGRRVFRAACGSRIRSAALTISRLAAAEYRRA